MSDCSDTAYIYSVPDYYINDKFRVFIFVNEVLGSNELKTFKYSSYNEIRREKKPPKSPFCKHMFQKSEHIAKKRFKQDASGRLYRNKEVSKLSIMDEYVADQSLVKPRYLIEFVTKHNDNVFNRAVKFIEEKLLFSTF